MRAPLVVDAAYAGLIYPTASLRTLWIASENADAFPTAVSNWTALRCV
jgi:glutamate/tyrosine decarboxylase-like PLP-dependent enzyme